MVVPATRLPPVAASYQSITSPAPAVADRLSTWAPLQKLCGLVAVGNDGKLLTVATTVLRLELTHPVVLFLASA